MTGHRDYDELSHAERKTYGRGITRTHDREIRVHVQGLDGRPAATLTPRILDGTVTIDVASDVSHRILSLRFLDPFRLVAFEPAMPYGGNMHRQFEVVVTDCRRIPELGCWVDVDVHTGPIWDFSRTGAEVSITAHGRDRLCRGTVRKARGWRKKAKKTTIIRELLSAAGIVDMRIPDLPARTSKKVTVGFAYRHHQKHVKGKEGTKGHDVTVTNRVPRTDHYLEPAEHLAESENRHLYWNGSGVAVLRPHPERPRLRATRHVLADPMMTRPGVDGPNVWTVLGKKPKGHHKRVKAKVALPPSNDLSAQSLAVNGKPYVVELRIDNPHLGRTAACARVGRRHRDRAVRITTELEVDLLPDPRLQEYDMIVVPTPHGDATILMRQWTLPLTADTIPMHVGSTVKPRPHHHRRHHQHAVGVG